MKKGDKVKVYLDPLICERLEGEATLTDRFSNNLTGLEAWNVIFTDDKEETKYFRHINILKH